MINDLKKTGYYNKDTDFRQRVQGRSEGEI